MMTEETLNVLSIVLPMVGAAVGAVVATKVSVARMREDVKDIFDQLHTLKNEVHTSNLANEVKHSEWKVAIARVETKLSSLRT